MTFDECSKHLRAEGFNHVEDNRWAKIIGPRKIAFAWVLKTESGHAIEYQANRT